MLSFIIILSLALSSSIAAKYKKGDPVTVYVNKVGPYYNPHETYHYYELPVCRPEKVEHKSLTLGEILDGDRMAVSLYKLKFLEKATEKVLCKLQLSATDVERLVHAIEELFFFEFVIDDLPVRGFVGKFEEEGVFPHRHQTYLYTKHKIEIEYNGDHIIFARIKPYDPVLLHEQLQELTVDFHFSVEWIASPIPFEAREKRLKELSLFPRALEIHWISIVNSAVLVVLLIGFISIILANILKKDFARYNVEEGGSVVGDEDLLRADEYGWKIIYGDVFRPPKYKTFFCAVIGCGCQLLAIATSVLAMAMFGMFNVHQHGRLNASLVLLYAFTSWIAGIVSAHFYRQFNGVNWVANINITSALFTGPVFLIWAMVNTTAWILGTTQALPWTTVLLFLVLFTCVGYPLTILGGIMGKNLTRPFEAPVRTKQIPREIPQLAFYKSPFFTAVIGGFLPFSSISVELYYLFATWWGREPYTLYGVLSLMYVILLSVSACIAVALLYFQLAAEDYRWWWRALGNTGDLLEVCPFAASNAPAGFELKRRRPQADDPQPGPSAAATVKFYSLADFDGPLLEHVRAVNAAAPSTLRDLVWALAFGRDGASDLDKFKAIFLWVATQDLFDEASVLRAAEKAGTQVKPRELAAALRQPLNNRKSFSSTFQLLCECSGLLVLIIGGQVKHASYRTGSAFADTDHRHSWNLVHVNGEWRAVDVTSAASNLFGQDLAFDEAVKGLEFYYFLPAPEHFAYSHHPDNPAHQLLANPVPTAQFRKWPIIKPAFFKRGMKLHSPDSHVGVIVGKTNVELHYQLPTERDVEDFSFVMRLEYEGGRDNYDGMKLSRYGIYELLDHQVQFHVRLPEASALYRLSLFAKELTPDVPASAPHDQVVEYRMPGMQAVRPFPPLLLSAYGPTEHAVDFDIRPLFDSSFLITAKGMGEIRFVLGKNVRLTASLKSIEKVSRDDLDRSVFTRTVVGQQLEGVVALHVPEAGEYGLEVFAYDPAVSTSGQRISVHVWSVFVVADAGSARYRSFPKLARTFVGPQIDNIPAGLVAVGHDDPFIKMEAAANQVKELTLEFQITNDLRYSHDLKEVTGLEERVINNFALGELNLADNKLAYTLRFPHYCFFIFGVFGFPKGEDREDLPLIYTYLIEVVPPEKQDANLKLMPPQPFPTQSPAFPLGCHLLEPLEGVISKAKQAQGPVRFHVEVPKKFDDPLISGQVERLLLHSANLQPSWMQVESIGEGGPTETWGGEISFGEKGTIRDKVSIAVVLSGDTSRGRVLLDYSVEK